MRARTWRAAAMAAIAMTLGATAAVPATAAPAATAPILEAALTSTGDMSTRRCANAAVEPWIDGTTYTATAVLPKDARPLWAPDSQHAAVMGTRIKVLDREGRKAIISNGLRVENLSPLRWSPDGSTLLFVAYSTDGDHVLYRYDVDTRELSEVTRAWRINGYDVSPTTGEIAVGLTNGGSGGYRMVADDPDLVIVDPVTLVPRVVMGGAGWPAYSPDGRSIAAFDGIGMVLLRDDELIATARRDDVAFDDYLLSYWDRMTPSWSPDGAYVAGLVSRGGTVAVVRVLTADGELAETWRTPVLYRMTWTTEHVLVTRAGFQAASNNLDTGTRAFTPRGGTFEDTVAHGAQITSYTGCGEVMVMNSVFKKRTYLAVADGWRYYYGRTAIAPDGTQLARMYAPGETKPRWYVVAH
ncbi:PD40 domain-containing protein [Demequina maris]|uniref:PD40 domain-containing protein n=1 Tax=Demequina maris TaxID=1638982 RepID=UPI0012E041E7|nr:PD40 domain-containing protein [Demequina maris]